MAECIVLKGGGGADLDLVTVTDPSDVIAGKVIVDKEGNPLTGTLALSGNATEGQVLYGQTYYNSDPKNKRTGTMPNHGAVNQVLGINGTYAIPAGYHNGSGRVTQNVATMAGQTITPGASQQTISCSGKYMIGNIVIKGVRTYAIKSGAVSTSGGKNFKVWNFGNVTTYYYYLDIPTGFTPLTATFRNISGSNPPFSNNTFFEGGQYVTNYSGYNGMINSSGGAQSDNTKMIVPVPGSGNYEYHISGYY